MALPTQWTWAWVNSESWWWTGRLVCCSSWGCKESEMTERLNWTVPEQGLSLNTSSPSSFTAFLQTNPSLDHSTLRSCTGDSTLRKETNLGPPAPGDVKARWLFQGHWGQSVRTPSIVCPRDCGLCHIKPVSTDFRGTLMKSNQPGQFDPTTVQPWRQPAEAPGMGWKPKSGEYFTYENGIFCISYMNTWVKI